MKFRLDYDPPPGNQQISHRHRLFLAGSCFADNIGRLLLQHHFQCTINPGGIVFDPLSMCEALERALQQAEPPELFLERGNRFFSFVHHSSVSAPSAQELRAQLHGINASTRNALLTADFIFLSFGTAFAYFLNESGQVVANCHKQPGDRFVRKLLDLDELSGRYIQLLAKIKSANPNVKVIITVSPVKYLKDGPVNNNISKATLLLLAHRLTENDRNCFYFPAFELLNDDLRDYRFYKEDLAHPNSMAITYIWEKFGHVFFGPKTSEVNREIEKLNRSLEHRTLHHHPEEAENLRASISRQKERIQQLEPTIRL